MSGVRVLQGALNQFLDLKDTRPESYSVAPRELRETIAFGCFCPIERSSPHAKHLTQKRGKGSIADKPFDRVPFRQTEVNRRGEKKRNERPRDESRVQSPEILTGDQRRTLQSRLAVKTASHQRIRCGIADGDVAGECHLLGR